MNEIDKALGVFQRALKKLNTAKERFNTVAANNTQEAAELEIEAEKNRKEARRAATIAAKIESLIGEDQED